MQLEDEFVSEKFFFMKSNFWSGPSAFWTKKNKFSHLAMHDISRVARNLSQGPITGARGNALLQSKHVERPERKAPEVEGISYFQRRKARGGASPVGEKKEKPSKKGEKKSRKIGKL